MGSAGTERGAPSGFDELWNRHPWPDRPPTQGVPEVGRQSSGFELVTDAIDARRSTTVVVEIGAEYGGSTRRFLANARTWVVSIDPWPDDYRVTSFPELDDHHGGNNTVYNLFQTFCWEYRDRLAMVRDVSPAGPMVVRDAGVPVDVVYIDGDHRYDAVMRDLTIADALFPGAVLCGDDWSMKSTRPKYEGMVRPVRKAVTSWAAFRDVHVEARGNTWLLDKSQPYNLERPPARFVDADSILADIDARTQRIEKLAKAPPTLPVRLYRKAQRRFAR